MSSGDPVTISYRPRAHLVAIQLQQNESARTNEFYNASRREDYESLEVLVGRLKMKSHIE
jgi:hypothetical protein